MLFVVGSLFNSIPDLKAAKDLPQPVLQDTTLASGIRVCTLETYEQVSAFSNARPVSLKNV